MRLIIKIEKVCRKNDRPLILYCNLMIPHGQATHDFFNLELRHHQYCEIIVIVAIFMLMLQIYIHFCELTRIFVKKSLVSSHNYGNR